MSAYYPSQSSHYSHGHGRHGHHGSGSSVVYSQQPYAQTANGYYPSNAPTTAYAPPGGVVYMPSSQGSGYIPPQVITVPSSHGHRHHGRHHRHRSSSRHHSHLTLGQRIARFFGFGNSGHYKIRSRHESWGFLGLGRRRRYVDARTGGEVDRKGRPVLTI